MPVQEPLGESASQTAGPYVHIGCVPTFAGLEGMYPDLGKTMVGEGAKGERIAVEGHVRDGTGTVLKDAMLEIGNFVGGATDAAVRGLLNGEVSVRSEGCQGVQAEAVPIFVYQPGTPLVIGEAKLKLHDFASFKLILQLPVLTDEAE